MRKETISGKAVELYDSPEELPIGRFHTHNRCVLIDSGVGSDLNDINDHIAKISRYISKGDKSNAAKTLENLRSSLYLISQGINTNHLSLVPFIKSIDNVECSDLSDKGMRDTLEKLKHTPKSVFESILDAVKKKFKRN